MQMALSIAVSITEVPARRANQVLKIVCNLRFQFAVSSRKLRVLYKRSAGSAMRGCIILFLALILMSGAQADEIPGTRFKHGEWSGAGFFSAASGRFTHCAIYASFRTGDVLHLSVNNDASMTVGVENPKFQFKQGSSFPVVLSVDGRKDFVARATAGADDFLVITFDRLEEVFTALKRGNRLRMDADSITGVYSLRGSGRALDQALECASNHLKYRSAPVNAVTQYDRSLLYQIAMEMIAESGLRDFEILTEKQIDELGIENAVIWQSVPPNLIGTVFLVPTLEGQALRDNDSADIEQLTRQCEGDVISGVRAVETAEQPTREIRVICSLEEQSRETISSKMMLEGVILYTTLIFIDHAGNQAMKKRDRQDLSEGIRLRAASYMKENSP